MLGALPRYLWELGTKDEELSLRVINYLRHVITVGNVSEANLQSLAQYMAPYFMSKHPKKGSLPGPWTKLQDDDSVIAALEAISWLRGVNITSTASDALEKAVQGALDLVESDDLQRWWATTDLHLQERPTSSLS